MTQIFGRCDETTKVEIHTPIDGECPKCGEAALELRVVQECDYTDADGWPVYDTLWPTDIEAAISCRSCYKALFSVAEYVKMHQGDS